jgi:hypothetical protein
MDADEAIRKHFRTSRRRILADNLPVLVRKGRRNVLANVFADLRFNYGAEIGTQKGNYANVLCHANPNLHLVCVDPWLAYGGLKQHHQDTFYSMTVEKLKRYNVTILKKTSMEALHDIEDESLDFVYIDAAHDFDNVVLDLVCWAYKVKIGGIISLHDYMGGHGAGVMKAIDGYTHCHNINPWYITREMEATAFWVKRDRKKYKASLSPLVRS